MAAEKGYWGLRPNVTLPPPAIYYRCPMKQACLGGLNATCQAGHTGRLCSSCEEAYYMSSSGCHPCPEEKFAFTTGGWIILVLLAIAAALALCFCKCFNQDLVSGDTGVAGDSHLLEDEMAEAQRKLTRLRVEALPPPLDSPARLSVVLLAGPL